MKKLIVVLFLIIVSLPAFAQSVTPTNFTPVLQHENEPARIFLTLNMTSMCSSEPTGSQFDIYNTQLNLGFIYNVAVGLDLGVGVHSGLFMPSGNDRSLKAIVGTDAMARYLVLLAGIFYGGIQAQIGYNYADFTPAGKSAHSIPVLLGPVVGLTLGDVVALYVFPAFEFGQTQKHSETGVWKDAIGMQAAVGTAINLGKAKFVIEAKPRFGNLEDKDTFGIDATVGVLLDF